MSDPFSLPPETVTPGQLYMALQALNARQATQNAELVRIRERIERQETETRDMLAAWRAGGTLLRLVKLAGAVAIACAAVAAFAKGIVVAGGRL